MKIKVHVRGGAAAKARQFSLKWVTVTHVNTKSYTVGERG